MNTFGPPQRVLVRGEGCYVWDADGNRYLDLLAGIAVNSLGHGHPVVHAAVTSQLATLGHVSNFFATPPQIALAERLLALLGHQGRVFFTNSGTEANEAAFKATRRTGRTKIVSTVNAFHGRSMGALAVTWKPAYRETFAPLPGDVTFVEYGDAAALAAAVDDETAAFVVEPIQGEAGVVEPPPGYLRAARDITSRHGALLWLDEVQTGVGRTGAWFAHTETGVVPDIVTLAKGLGSGFPIGACIGVDASGALLGPGDHGTTFGGNPVASVAALATLGVIKRDDLLAHVRRVGDRLAAQVADLRHPVINHVRGRGLLRGIALYEPVAARVATAALRQGFIVNAPTPSTIRLAPPLIVTSAQLDTFVDALPDLIDIAQREGTS
ncbi:MAG: acetylornithine transaminase [Nocardioidaceae bacterium]|nr:acetylornithine transaminase [Nocardioidaceae bacterium]